MSTPAPSYVTKLKTQVTRNITLSTPRAKGEIIHHQHPPSPCTPHMCVEGVVLYKCGHHGRSLGYELCTWVQRARAYIKQGVPDNDPQITINEARCEASFSVKYYENNDVCGACKRRARDERTEKGKGKNRAKECREGQRSL